MMLVTIFTPTYNRGYIISKLYNSLKQQTFQNFEWVIVDDGSTDDTNTIINSFIKENNFPIIYQRQPNQGKHIAINRGVQVANGDLFFIVDSDDYLTRDAIEKVSKIWGNNKSDENVSGIIAYRKFHNNQIIGTMLPNEVNYSTLRETNEKYYSIGDKVVIYRTNILRKFPFPQYNNEKFMGESCVFNQIDELYKMVILKEGIYYCEYLKDGLSQDFRKLYRDNPNGFLLFYEQELKYSNKLVKRIKIAANCDCLYIRLGMINRVLRKPFMLIRLVSVPIGIYLYIKYFILKTSDVKPYKNREVS